MLIRWISGFGSTSQVFSFGGIDASGGIGDTELYYRSVQAVNATIVEDYERLIGNEVGDYVLPVAAVPQTQPAVAGNLSPKQALGRGPGTAKQQLVQGGGSPGGLLWWVPGGEGISSIIVCLYRIYWNQERMKACGA
jgi:hypothetical protein